MVVPLQRQVQVILVEERCPRGANGGVVAVAAGGIGGVMIDREFPGRLGLGEGLFEPASLFPGIGIGVEDDEQGVGVFERVGALGFEAGRAVAGQGELLEVKAGLAALAAGAVALWLRSDRGSPAAPGEPEGGVDTAPDARLE